MDYRGDVQRALEVAPIFDEAPLKIPATPGGEIVVPTIADLADLQMQVMEFDIFRNVDPQFMADEREHEAQHAEANSYMGFESVFALRFDWIRQEGQNNNQPSFQHFCRSLGRLTFMQHLASSIYPHKLSPGDLSVANGNAEKAARRIQQENVFSNDPLPLPLWYTPSFRKLFF